MEETRNPVVAARLAALTAHFGDRLSDAQWADVVEDLQAHWHAAETLRRVDLTLDDPPMSWLSCRPEESYQ